MKRTNCPIPVRNVHISNIPRLYYLFRKTPHTHTPLPLVLEQLLHYLFVTCFFPFFPGTICLLFATIWNQNLELEPVILHGLCYILAWSLCALDGICCIWQCSPSILPGYVPHVGTSTSHSHDIFWYFKRSCDFLRVPFGFPLGFHVRFLSGFPQDVISGFFRILLLFF